MQVILGGRLRSVGSTPRPGPTGKNRFLRCALPFLPASSLFAPRIPRLSFCYPLSFSSFLFLALSVFVLPLFLRVHLLFSPFSLHAGTAGEWCSVGESPRDFMIRRDQIHLCSAVRGCWPRAQHTYSQFHVSWSLEQTRCV